MLSNLLEICHKFLQLNAFFEKLTRPTARINPDDLECLDFSRFAEIRRCDRYEDLVWALRILADQAGEAFAKAKGSRWERYEEDRATWEQLDVLQQLLIKMNAKFKSVP